MDEFLWLEDIESQKSMAWVADYNEAALARLQGDDRFETLQQSVLQHYTADDRIPAGVLSGNQVHNFWQDKHNVRGVWRVASLDSYRTGTPIWEVVLDIDELANQEGENWVYKGRVGCGPDYKRYMVAFSRGGSDAVVYREFDFMQRTFVERGFDLPEAKTDLAWVNEDCLLVATDFGPDSLTRSGYARQVRRWDRETVLDDAPIVTEATVEDIVVFPMQTAREGAVLNFVSRRVSFFEEEVIFLRDDGHAVLLPFPRSIDFRGYFQGRALAVLRSDWRVDNELFAEGALVAMDLEASIAEGVPVGVESVFEPTDHIAIKEIALGKDRLLLSVMEDVSGVLLDVRPGEDGWNSQQVDVPGGGAVTILPSTGGSPQTLALYESFTAPVQLMLMEESNPTDASLIMKLADRFNPEQIISEQLFATSADGTQVPYYVVRASNAVYDSTNPTIIYAYGGFEVPLTPTYLSALGIEWLKSGGVYVQANIRGGGEYGPGWHKAALLSERQRAYDDFIAVSEALIDTGLTSPPHLGIRGGSNGGLLVGVMTTQRPDLFGAVVCAVPLLDMLRYHHLSAGASWMSEYGDPDDPEQRAFIESYSPMQNIAVDVSYPEVFFWTNMRDDRVHPSHARRMVARLSALGHKVIYYENTEGGHGGGADPVQLADTTAMELVYFLQELSSRQNQASTPP